METCSYVSFIPNNDPLVHSRVVFSLPNPRSKQKVNPQYLEWIFPLIRRDVTLPWEQGSWEQHGAHLGPTGLRWAPCWSHELCYPGSRDLIHLSFIVDIIWYIRLRVWQASRVRHLTAHFRWYVHQYMKQYMCVRRNRHPDPPLVRRRHFIHDTFKSFSCMKYILKGFKLHSQLFFAVLLTVSQHWY